MKKLIALIACLAMLLALAAGCGSGTEVEYYDTGAEEETPAPAEAAPAATGVMTGGTGYETYAPDTVTGTVNGEDVTWMEYFYWLNYYTNYYVQLAAAQGVTLTSWDAAGELSATTANGDALVAMTQYTLQQYHAVSTQAKASGITLTEEDEAILQQVYDSNCDTDGDGEVTEEEIAAFEEYLASQNVDRDFFLYLNRVALLSDRVFDEYYGVNGEKCPDAVVTDYINGAGAMYAKHILLLTVDANTREALDEDTVAMKKDTADTLYAELAAVEDDKDALNELFDEYMAEYTEDTGYAANPDGYIFGPGEMVTEFEDAVLALDENYGLSEVVESPYGYHIILRMPLTPDTVIGTNSDGMEVNIRYAAAEQQFSALLGAWTDSVTTVWNEGFETPDMQAIFG